MHCICVESVKISVESVVESLVSKYEKHFDSSRQPTEEHAVDEMIILENGPLLHQADNVIEKAMRKYWKNGEWHFIRKHENVRSYTGGSRNLSFLLCKVTFDLQFLCVFLHCVYISFLKWLYFYPILPNLMPYG